MPSAVFVPPALISYDEWMTRTSLRLRPRNDKLKALDYAIQMYDRTRHIKAYDRIKKTLKEWQASIGPRDEWKKDARNESGAFSLLDSQLRGFGDSDVGLGAPAFMQPALVNARLGVLYLFSHTYTEDIFKVILEGGIDLLKTGLADAPGALTGSDLSGGSFAAGGLSVAMATDKPQALAARAERAVVSQSTRNIVSSRDLIDKPPPSLARTPAGRQLLADSRVTRFREELRAKLLDCAAKIWNLAKEAFVSIRSAIGNKLNQIKEEPLEHLPQYIRKLVDFLTEHFLDKAAPYIKGGLNIAKGVVNTVDSSITKYREWRAGRNVQLLAGHAGTIVEAIRRSMWFSVGEGLYDLLKGGVSFGLDVGAAGVGAVVSLVVSVLETLAKVIWKMVELIRMRSFFGQARQFWLMREERNAIHMQPIAFNNWFKSYAIDIPALSVLTLNSGICGDKMHFLAMFKDDSSVVSQSEFDAGCAYVDSLKVWGASYLKDSGFEFKSDDPLVRGLLTLATSHTAEKSTRAKVWQTTLGFLNAGD